MSQHVGIFYQELEAKLFVLYIRPMLKADCKSLLKAAALVDEGCCT